MKLFHLERTLAPALVLALLPVPLAAQGGGEVRGVIRDEIDVRLAEIKVVVTDSEGWSVTGLTREDFEVRQGRRRLPVTHFSAFEDGRPVEGIEGEAPQVAEPPRTAADRLYLVLYVDHAYMVPGELEDVVRAVRGFLDDALRPKDRVMLVEANHSLEIVEPFTSLPSLIDRRLGELEPQSPRGRARSEFPQLMREIERVARRGPDMRALSRSEQPMAIKSQIDGFVGQVHHEIARSTHQLHRLIPTLAGLPGRKEILYIGGSMPSDAGQRLYSAWRTAFGPSSVYEQARSDSGEDDGFGRLVNTSPEAAARQGDTNDLFRQVVDRANAAGVTLHMLDTGGLRRASAVGMRTADVASDSGSASFGDLPDLGRRLGDPEILRMMAEETGGRSLVHSRDFETPLNGLAHDLHTYYVLAFEPPEDDGELHPIRIRLKGKRSKLTVRHRQTYRDLDLDRVAAGRVVSAVTLGEVDNPLGIELAADPPKPVEGEEGVVVLPLYVIFAVDKLQLVPDPQGHRGQVSIYLTTGDLEHGAGEVKKTVVPLTFTPEQLEDAHGRNIEYKLELPMAAGSRRLAVTLRDDLCPLTSTVVLDLGG